MLLLGGRSLLRSPTLRVARAPTLLMAVAARALSAPLPRPPSISAAFDSGNIEVSDVACGADDAHTFTLKIRNFLSTPGATPSGTTVIIGVIWGCAMAVAVASGIDIWGCAKGQVV